MLLFLLYFKLKKKREKIKLNFFKFFLLIKMFISFSFVSKVRLLERAKKIENKE